MKFCGLGDVLCETPCMIVSQYLTCDQQSWGLELLSIVVFAFSIVIFLSLSNCVCFFFLIFFFFGMFELLILHSPEVSYLNPVLRSNHDSMYNRP